MGRGTPCRPPSETHAQPSVANAAGRQVRIMALECFPSLSVATEPGPASASRNARSYDPHAYDTPFATGSSGAPADIGPARRKRSL